MVSFLIVNLLILVLELFFFMFFKRQSGQDDDEDSFVKFMWYSLFFFTSLFFLLAVILYLLVHCKNPGYTRSISEEQFPKYLDRALKEGRNLDYFCFFCRALWSSTSVHCMACKTCIEGFDHHCNFVNNCIGFGNHRFFLMFLVAGFFYAVFIIMNTIWIMLRRLTLCDEDESAFKICNPGLERSTVIVMSWVTLSITFFQIVPLSWQLFMQVKKLC